MSSITFVISCFINKRDPRSRYSCRSACSSFCCFGYSIAFYTPAISDTRLAEIDSEATTEIDAFSISESHKKFLTYCSRIVPIIPKAQKPSLVLLCLIYHTIFYFIVALITSATCRISSSFRYGCIGSDKTVSHKRSVTEQSKP